MRLSCRIRFAVEVLSLVFLLLSANHLEAADVWTGAAEELARKIIPHIGAGKSMTVTLRNLSSLGDTEITGAGRALRAQLRSQGAHLRAAPEAADVRVTLSENFEGFLWVAEIRRDQARNVVMVLVPRRQPESAPQHSQTLVLRRTLLLDRDEPMLDLTRLGSSQEAAAPWLVLGGEKISLYQTTETGWEEMQSADLPRDRPSPRDLRGRLVGRSSNTFEVYLPGTKCAGAVRSTLILDCRASDEAWPLGVAESEPTAAHFNAQRNFFDGKLAVEAGQEKTVPPFFSMASLVEKGSTFRIFSGLDGGARLFEESPEPIATFDGWGGDIASLKSGCGRGWQVLATRAAESTEADGIQGYEVANRKAVPVSAVVEFPGPVTALWPAADASTATAVARNLKTGRYEAYSLSVSCGQ